MKQGIFWVVLLGLVCAPAFTAQADDFNGSKPFVCAIIDANECGVNEECRRVLLEDIDCPRFLKVNLAKKLIVGTMTDQSTRDVKIESISHVDGNLILQGTQKGRVWSLIVSENTGEMTLGVSGQGEGFVFFGESFLP